MRISFVSARPVPPEGHTVGPSILQSVNFLNSSAPLVPPKPNEFESA